MCSIIGSFDKDKVVELCELNAYRGQYTHSINYFDVNRGTITIHRREGAVDYSTINIPQGNYCIVHMQAPTTENTGAIHPAYYEGSYLWHNGILKQKEVARLKDLLQEITDWDTYLLLKAYSCGHDMGSIDGSFSCLLYAEKSLVLFRNEISPMFIDDDMSISSTKFSGSASTNPNVFLTLNFQKKTVSSGKTFKTAENPYFFA
jgi:hypothetical protein